MQLFLSLTQSSHGSVNLEGTQQLLLEIIKLHLLPFPNTAFVPVSSFTSSVQIWTAIIPSIVTVFFSDENKRLNLAGMQQGSYLTLMISIIEICTVCVLVTQHEARTKCLIEANETWFPQSTLHVISRFRSTSSILENTAGGYPVHGKHPAVFWMCEQETVNKALIKFCETFSVRFECVGPLLFLPHAEGNLLGVLV